MKNPARWIELATKLVAPLDKLGTAIADAVRRGRERRKARRAARKQDAP